MPRICTALREGKAAPIARVLAETPDIPKAVDGAALPRLTSSRSRWSTARSGPLYGWYAPDRRMRANIGIRRRLAPLLDNSRAELDRH